MDIFDATAEFNREIIGLPFPRRPQRLSASRKEWTATAITEERDELLAAPNVSEEADALLDNMYFSAGRLYEMGIAPDVSRRCLAAIHGANMQKVRGSLSKRPNSLGYDAVKPKDWKAPDLSTIIGDAIYKADVADLTQTPPLLVDLKPTLQVTDYFAPGGPASSPSPASTDLVFPAHPVGAPYGWSFLLTTDASQIKPSLPKIILLGHARHGKDTVAEMLRDGYGYRFRSSSEFCAEKVVMPWFNDPGNRHIPYQNVDECYADRVNHRDLWFRLITEYNTPDKSRLACEIFRDNDLYCGMRNKRELWACQNAGVGDVVIWVDRSEHVPPEGADSCTVEPWMADFVLDNNGTLWELQDNLRTMMRGLGVYPTE